MFYVYWEFKHVYNIYATSTQRLRRWSNIVQMSHKCFLFTESSIEGLYYTINIQDVDQMTECCFNVLKHFQIVMFKHSFYFLTTIVVFRGVKYLDSICVNIWIRFTHLKLWNALARRDLKWVKISSKKMDRHIQTDVYLTKLHGREIWASLRLKNNRHREGYPKVKPRLILSLFSLVEISLSL